MINYKVYPEKQKLNKPCVATIGKFDGVHLGHRTLIQKVLDISKDKKQTPTLITFDPHPREYFDGKENFVYLQSLEDRITTILKLEIEQIIVLEFDAELETLTPKEFFEQLLIAEFGVESIVIGEDFSFGQGKSGDVKLLQELCDKNKIALNIIPRIMQKNEPISSSRIRKERFEVKTMLEPKNL